MKRTSLIAIILVVLFLIPSSGKPYLDTSSDLLQSNDEKGNSVYSQDSEAYSGTGDPIYYEISGTAKNGTTLTIDSTTSGSGTVGIDTGFTGSNLDAVLDTLNLHVDNALANPSWTSYHTERFLVGSGSDSTPVHVPNSWTLIDSEASGDDHPRTGFFVSNDTASTGYGGSRGFFFGSKWKSGDYMYSTNEIYMSQMVAAPYRDVTSIQVSFYYYVDSASDLYDQCYLFVRVAGHETKVRVFELGDTTGTWLQYSFPISPTFLQSLTFPNSLLFEIGLGTDQNGLQFLNRISKVYVDEIVMSMDVRPFPEQIDLKLNNTAVVGSIPGSISQYVPYGSGRDCYDYDGIDLDGYSDDGVLSVGIWDSVGYFSGSAFQGGLQFPVDIPQGAVITSAYFELESGGSDGLVGMNIYMADEDDSSAFTTGTPVLEDRYSWLGASIDWSLSAWTSNIRYSSPDVSSLLQSVLARPGWESGNYITIMLESMYSADDTTYNDFKGTYGLGTSFSSYDLPRLVVEYLLPLEDDIIQNQHFNLPYYKDIIIHSSQVPATLNNFPVMLDIYDSDLRTDAQPDGSDIMFTVDGNPVYHEIETFEYENSTHAHLVAWVKVPTLSGSSDTTIRMHYGGFSINMDSANVWNNYEMVQHMDDNPSGKIYDSTWNNHDGVSNGSMTSSDIVAGQVGYGTNFDGINDAISVGQIDTDDWSSFSISAWVYRNDTGDDRIFSKAPDTTVADAIIHFAVRDNNFRIRYSTDYDTAASVDAGGATAQTWHYLVWTWSAATAYSYLYVDGSLVTSSPKDGVTPEDSTLNFTIGNWELSDSDPRNFNGTIDELRMTTMVLSTNWIDTEFNNQYSPDTFYSVGTENTNTMSWSGGEDAQFLISTSSTDPIDVGITLSMDFIGTGSSLDENMQDGTSFVVTNASLVEWTANILISPPALTDTMDFVVNYPMTEWTPISVTNPIGQAKTEGVDWDYTGGELTIFASAVDIWGVWVIKFNSWNYVQDIQLGINGQALSDTATFQVGDVSQFRATTPWIENAKVGFVLTDPTDTVWYETSATTGTPGATWHLPSFQYRKVLTIPASQVDADVNNFPIMVSFSDTDLAAHAQSDGDDIVFTDSSGNVLAHEIERYDAGTLVAWVKANLTSTLSNTLYMYYGNPVIGSIEQSTEVWTNNYDAVWHLSEDYTDETSGNPFFDSTSGNYTGTGEGTTRTSGIGSGYGQNFDGNDWITVNASEGLDPIGDLTLSGWFYIADSWGPTSSPTRVIMAKYLDGDTNFHIALTGSDYTETLTSPGSLAFGFEYENSEITMYTLTTSWSAGWYYYSCYMDSDIPSNNKIFINGVDDTNTTYHGSSSLLSLDFNTDWGIGGRYMETSEIAAGEGFYTGTLDEIRIASGSRVSGWISTEYKNINAPTTFVQRGSQQTRTSPELSVTKTIDSTAPAGIWTVSAYYNDTGSSIADKTGLYEREFLVKHDTSLSLISPGDAVGDHFTVKYSGDLLYVEVFLEDTDTSLGVTGSIVTMNWSISGSPTVENLHDFGEGYYGITLNASDLNTLISWRINIQSSHPYYTDSSTYFDLDVYRRTSLTYRNVSTTPAGFDFKATLVYWDTYTDSPITGAAITFANGTPVTVEAQGGGFYNISIPTSGLGFGTHILSFNATKAGTNLEIGNVDIPFVLRKHFTTVSVTGDTTTPYGEVTPLTVILIDTDTGTQLDASYVDSFTFSWFGPSSEEFDGSSLSIDLDTSTWSVSSRTVTLSLVMSNTNYYNPADYDFDVTIRAHYTAVSVGGGMYNPWGVNTKVNISLIDLDTGDVIGMQNVSNLAFISSYGTQNIPTPTQVDNWLFTNGWSVGTTTVTLQVSMLNPIYATPNNYVFEVEMRIHYTTLMVSGDFTTAHALTTPVTVTILDTDASTELLVTDVESITFSWPGDSQVETDPISSFDIILDTQTWIVGNYIVTTHVVLKDSFSLYYSPADFAFNVTIRGHHTSASVSGDLIQPYGYTTQITISIIDLDTGQSVLLSKVANYSFDWIGGGSPDQFVLASSWVVTLNTNTWPVTTRTVSLTIGMSDPIFAAPDVYQFDVTIRKHRTSLNVQGNLITPFGFDTNLTIVLTDLDTGLLLDTSSVSRYTFGTEPTVWGPLSDFNHTLDTNSWSTGTYVITLNLVMTGNYFSPPDYDFQVVIRKHFVTVGVEGVFTVPYGFTTDVTVVIFDSDTGQELTQTAIDSFSFASSYETEGDPGPNPIDLVFTLTTDDWPVGPDTVTLSVVMDNTYYIDPDTFDFQVTIRNHYTTASVQGDFLIPYGETTALTIVIFDSDTGATLTHTSVTSFHFSSVTYGDEPTESLPSSLDYILDTSSWNVGPESVTLHMDLGGIYYDPSTFAFSITIRERYTSVSVSGNFTKPTGFNTSVTIQIIDLDSGMMLTSGSVASFTFNPIGYNPEGEISPSDLDYVLDSDGWGVGYVTITLSVVMSGNYADPSNYNFEIRIRKHLTSVSVEGDTVTPYGFTTSLSLILTDLDTTEILDYSTVTSFSFTSTFETEGDPGPNPTDLDFTLTTDDWSSIGTFPVILSVVMKNNHSNPIDITFYVTIREHYTQTTVVGDLTNPYGNNTPLTIVITDIDLGITLDHTDVNSFNFTSVYGTEPQVNNPSSLDYVLNTGSWSVGNVIVTLHLDMGGIYYNPSSYNFIVHIHSMSTYLYNEPSDLLFPIDDAFIIILRFNVSESGNPNDGSPIASIPQSDFTVRNSTYTYPATISYLGDGRYNLTISATFFPAKGTYTIIVEVNPTDNRYGDASLLIIFEYRPAVSFLSSENYPQVVTPYNTDVIIFLNYTDVDRNKGISGAIISASGISIYGVTEITPGLYSVTLDVSGLDQGTHYFNITASSLKHDDRTLRNFRVLIRIVFTYAIPTVAALDIPVGNDPVFYVEYWDIDHDVSIDSSAPFLLETNWIRSVIWVYEAANQRYKITFPTEVDDPLQQNTIVFFNFSKGSNYQFGQFNITVSLRTHNTDFRLVNAIEPTSYNANVTIEVFYGDLDDRQGIQSSYVVHRVVLQNGTQLVSYLYYSVLGAGYYDIVFHAGQFAGPGLYNFTVYFNWTGPVETYQNRTISAAVNIIGVESRYTLIAAAEPTAYLENMTFTFLYSDFFSGDGIDNVTTSGGGNVFVSVSFQGESVDLSKVDIWEVDYTTYPGRYSIRFNTTLFGKTGVIYMNVYVKWAKGVEPFYSNRTDVIAVRITPRDTILSIVPPTPTPYGENATFSFTYDDVTGAGSVPISYNDLAMSISLSLSDFSLFYNDTDKTFTVSFDTGQFSAPVGQKSFTLSVDYTGAPFYADILNRIVLVTVTLRETVLEYQTPTPTSYGDVVTFSLIWTDVTGEGGNVTNADVTLYDQTNAVYIGLSYYNLTKDGGIYTIDFDSSYYIHPGTFGLRVYLTNNTFFMPTATALRSFVVRYRATILTSDPVPTNAYDTPVQIVLYYQDFLTLDNIDNTTFHASFEILNSEVWYISSTWVGAPFNYYLLTVETYNHPGMTPGNVTYLQVRVLYDDVAPYYNSRTTIVNIETRERYSSLDLTLSPSDTSYLEYVNFSVRYYDIDGGATIPGASIAVYKGVTTLAQGVDYIVSAGVPGFYDLSVLTTALDGLGATSLKVSASIVGIPYHATANLTVTTQVVKRTSNVEILTAPSATSYLEDVMFVFAFTDAVTGAKQTIQDVDIYIYNQGTLMTRGTDYILNGTIGRSFEVTVNSATLSSVLITNLRITVQVIWDGSAPYYRDDSSSTTVSIIARETVVSISPPINTPYGENATFTFEYIDVTGGANNPIAFDALHMDISTSLTETPAISGVSEFTVSFNTAQFGGIGQKTFLLNVIWTGAPYYSSRSSITIRVTVTLRPTLLEFESPDPTPFGDSVIFSVTYLDIAGTSDFGIPDGSLILYFSGSPIPGIWYSVSPKGSGVFEVDFDAGYFNAPGTYTINASMTYTGSQYKENAWSTRNLRVTKRSTILSNDPVGLIGYETTMEVTLNYQDTLTLSAITNSSSVFFSIENTTGTWLYTITWQPATQKYLLRVETESEGLQVGVDYSLHIKMTNVYAAPFYADDDTYIQFTVRGRVATVDLVDVPVPTPYNDYSSYRLYYWDTDEGVGIADATIVLETTHTLTLGTDYYFTQGAPGYYNIFVNTAALGSLGSYSVKSTIVWSGIAPYYNDASKNATFSVTRRPTSVDLITPPSQVRYLDNITFTIAFTDVGTLENITSITVNDIEIRNAGTLLLPGEYMILPNGEYFDISIDSEVISSQLVSGRILTITVNQFSYYQGDSTQVRVTTTNRLGQVTVGQSPVTPMNDNMKLTFNFTDESTGDGISGAVGWIYITCDQVPGLIQGINYTVQALAYPGGYQITLPTKWLDDFRVFTFKLDILWSGAVSPYYSELNDIPLSGTVKRRQTSLSYNTPSPATVPFNDYVTIVMTLLDVEPTTPSPYLNDMQGSFTIIYQGGGVPSTFDILPQIDGQYVIRLNTSDAGSVGLKTIIVTFSEDPYESAQKYISFQVRNRHGSIQEYETNTEIFAGDEGYLIVKLNDTDANNLIDGASVTTTWDGPVTPITHLGGGYYRINITTESIDYGTYTLKVTMVLARYDISPVYFEIRVDQVETNLILKRDRVTVYWKDAVDLVAYYNDTVHVSPIEDAIVYFNWTGGNGLLSMGNPGNYSKTISTSIVNAGTYIVTITATYPNHVLQIRQFTVSILQIPVVIQAKDDKYVFDEPRGAVIDLEVTLWNTITGMPLDDVAVIQIEYEFNSGEVTDYFTHAISGTYNYQLLTEDTASSTSYYLLVTGSLQNYLISPILYTLVIKQSQTLVELDESIRDIANETYYWYQLINISVWVKAPDYLELNDTDKGFRRDATVLLSLIPTQGGTAYNFILLNGSIEGPHHYGYYYRILNCSEERIFATSYAVRISITSLADPEFSTNSTTTTLRVAPIPTSVISGETLPIIWGGSRNYTFTFQEATERGLNITGAIVTYQWGKQDLIAYDLGNGSYSIFIDSYLETPSTIEYPIRIQFTKDNYELSTKTVRIRINAVPTEIVTYAPAVNIDENVFSYQYQNFSNEILQVPYGDQITVILFYNATALPSQSPENGGITGAIWTETDRGSAQMRHIEYGTEIWSLTEIGFGNYSFTFNTLDYQVHTDVYKFIIPLWAANRSINVITIQILIINIPTALSFESSNIVDGKLQMFYGDSVTIDILYYDTWFGHDNRGVSNGVFTVVPNKALANVTDIEEIDLGVYRLTISADVLIPIGLEDDSTDIVINVQFGNHTMATIDLEVLVQPTVFQNTLTSVTTLGTPILFLLLLLGFLYVRVLSVPKRLRQINGQIKQLRKGKVPKPIKEAKRRDQLIADLFNDTYEEVGITRRPDQLPPESVIVAVPEMGELLIQLSILTHLSPTELDEFKADISKMRLSEQAAFVKEVIYQEAIRAARRDGKTVEQVLEDVAADASRRVAGGEEGTVPTKEYRGPEDKSIFFAEEDTTKKPPIDFDEPVEFEEEGKETEFIIKKPDKKADRMADKRPDDYIPERPSGPDEKLSPFELEELRKELEQKGVPPHEIDTIMEQAEHLTRELVEELVKSLTGEK